MDSLSNLHPDLVQRFLKTGEGKGIPQEIQEFIVQLQFAAEIYEHERNISRAAKLLSTRVKVQTGVDLSEGACKDRIYSAITYFNIDNNVAVKVWENDFANKYEDLAKYCIAKDDTKTAKRCYDAALECRVRASEAADKEASWAPVFILSPDVSLTQLGFEKKSLKEIARKHNEGYYLNLINNLPIETKEKKRLLRDANIDEAEFEEMEDGE